MKEKPERIRFAQSCHESPVSAGPLSRKIDPSSRINPFALFLKVLFPLFLITGISGCGEGKIDPLINKANKEWVKGNNFHAVELFKTVLKQYPSGPLAEEALFRLGEIHHFGLENSEQAIRYFQEVLELNPRGIHAREAQNYITEIVEFTFKDYNQAIIEYQNLINNFDKEEEKQEHQFRIAALYYKMHNYEQALVEWENLEEKYPDSQWTEESAFKIVEILYTLQRCSEARERYERFLLMYPNSEFRGEMEFIMASCLEEEGKLKEAFNRFKALENDYNYPMILRIKLDGLKKRMKKNKKRGKSRKK